MSIEAIGWAKYRTCKTPSEKLLLFILANYADEVHSCFPSEKHLAKICGISDRQIRRCLASLVEQNYIKIVRRKGTSNRYYLRMEAHVHTVRTHSSSNTKPIQKKRGKINELAG